MTGHSLDITADNIARLQQLFPDVVSEGRVDFERLRAALGAADALVPTGPEHYELRWAGKADARREVQRPTTATLLPDPARSVDFDTTGNVFIEGENLEVLRVLQRGYFGKVKMIYIDPPYNTGSDSFVYPDDYSERREDYEKRSGQRDENGFLNKQDLWKKNTRESGQYHSAWLSMMWPRLYLSRNLLREDGVIFVSIDDNEVHNLRLLMNEVFGEENFVATIVWQKKYGPANDAKLFSATHEYLLCFAKSKENWAPNLLGRTGEQLAAFKNPDNDPRGSWRASDLSARTAAESCIYPIVGPTGKEFMPPNSRSWIVSRDGFTRLLDDNRIWFGTEQDARPMQKKFLSEIKEGITPQTWWGRDFAGDNKTARYELKDLFPENIFDTPKPSSLIKRLLEVAVGADEGALILDFFAGSGTTAQAVMDLNEQDGGNRNFLLVQMAEVLDASTPAYQAGYRTIADITQARLLKVSQKLRATRAGQLALGGPAPDTGFRTYRLDYSNFLVWRSELTAAPDVLAQLELFQEPLRNYSTTGAGPAMLTELLLKMTGGADLLPLSAPVARREVDGLEVHDVHHGLVWLALAGISPAIVAAAVAEKPQRLVVPGRFFGPDNPDEQVSNARLQLADAGVTLQLI